MNELRVGSEVGDYDARRASASVFLYEARALRPVDRQPTLGGHDRRAWHGS